MRQWLVNPKMLCRKHLLGEHVETHMTVGAVIKNKNINGFINDGLIDLKKVKERHNELVQEMIVRGYNHKSPLPSFFINRKDTGNINILGNIEELKKRCPECKKRIDSILG